MESGTGLESQGTGTGERGEVDAGRHVVERLAMVNPHVAAWLLAEEERCRMIDQQNACLLRLVRSNAALAARRARKIQRLILALRVVGAGVTGDAGEG